MDRPDPYHNLRFERQERLSGHRGYVILGCLALFTLLWLAVPHRVLYWLLLPVLALLLWIASYGWRRALVAVHELVHRLEEL
jgi:hypothetical protein